MSYTLCDFGSYTVAGRVHQVTEGMPREINFTRSASYTHDPRGHFAFEHAYVQYFIPETRRDAPPVILVHGGGMHGSTWETTPDERPGWVNLLVDEGYETHVLDNVERGRSGFMSGLWNDDPILRSQEEAWTLFRIGPPEGFADRKPFPGARFPVAVFDRFARMQVPRWLSTTPLHVAALVAVLRRVGPAIVICHSQGGEIAQDAMHEVPELFAGLVALEPSTRLADPAIAKRVPTVLAAGDYLDAAEHWVERQRYWREWRDRVTGLGGRATLLETGDGMPSGHSHLLTLDAGSEDCFYNCFDAL